MILERLSWLVICPPCELPSLNSYPEEVPVGGQGEVDLAPNPVVGLVLQAGNAEKFPEAVGLKKQTNLCPFLRVRT